MGALFLLRRGPGGWPPGALPAEPDGVVGVDDAVADTLADMFGSLVIGGSVVVRDEAV